MRFLRVASAFFAFVFFAAAAQAQWANGYTYSGAITVNATQVPNADETNFPVLVSGTYADLATTGNGGKVTSANGYDIIFTSDAAGLNALKFERESYSPTGQVAFWVRVPSLSHTTNTTFYVFYGNAAVSTDQSTKTGVWDSNYVGVWHLADNAVSPVVSDSTANGNNGTAAANTNAKTASGKIGSSALSFNGTTDRVTTNVTSATTFTWEAWFNSGSVTGTNYQSVITIDDPSSYVLMDVQAGAASFWVPGTDSLVGFNFAITGLANNTWYHLVFVRTAPNSPTGYSVYLNGTFAGQRSTGNWSSTSPLSFGSRPSVPAQTFSGALDEIRVSNVARSPSWIAAEYNNENNPSSFYSAVWGQTSGGIGNVSVPNVGGQTQTAASTAITGAGLSVGAITTASSSSVASGSVISQNPIAGTSVAPGTSVALLVSSGPPNVSVPNVGGQTQTAASTAITGAGLSVGAITTASSSSVASGSVISQNPTGGTSVAPGTSVALLVSSGPPNVSVPNVVGQTQSAASTAITGAGLSVGAITTASSSSMPSGSVISQNPTAGTSVTPGASVALLVSSGSGSGGGSGYGFFGTITVNASQVPSVDETNFPVLVSGTYADLATTGNGGKVTSANGYDIIFTSDAAGLNKLNFERESYSPTGQVAFWVQIPNLSHTVNTTFYVFYGNAAISTDQSSKNAVWDSNYVGVWHMSDNAGSTLVSDSTANGNNGAAAANTNTKTTSGKVGGSALSFNGSTDRVTTNVTSGKAFTWEAWINSGTLSTSQYQSILTIPGTSYMLMDLGGSGGSFWTADAISGSTLGVAGLSNNVWYQLVFVRSGDSATTGYSAYLNGIQTGQKATGIWSSTSPLAFGSRLDATGQSFAGALDEIRVSNIARSASWIATEYNNENNPSLFYTAVLNQSTGGGGVSVPNVAGQTQTAASTAIIGAGLTVGGITTASSSSVPSGSVISENPTAGTSVAPGTSVALLVSIGPPNVSVPNVGGQTQTAASTAITGAGLSVGAITTASSSSVASGSVISQNPTAGTSVAPGTSVALLVSSGPPNVSVPNVAGQTQTAASTAITGAGLSVGAITTASSSSVASGSVISQNPTAGTSVAPGTSVALLVSSGPPNVSVPNVAGQTQTAASTAITGAGLTVGGITTASSSTVPSGSVISENPTAGTSVAPGTSVGLVVSTGPSSGPAGYAFSGTITINASQVPNTDLLNFPVLISGTYPQLATLTNGGTVSSSNGYDIIFTSDAAGANRLNFEREYYAPTGQVVFWVQIPLLSHTTNTTFYMFYGNPAITADQSAKTAVWDSNYLGVWHMADAAASTLVSDSTTNGNNGVAAANTNAKSAAGKIDGALTFNGLSDSVATNVSSGKTFTWEAWVYSGSMTSSNFQSILTMDGTSYLLMDLTGGKGSFWTRDALEGNSLGIAGLGNNTWYQIVFKRSGDSSTTGYSAYVNGILQSQAASGVWSGSSGIAFGTRLDYTGQNFTGVLDEVRVSNIARSSDWIAAEYNNQGNPASFYTIDLQQASSTPPAGGPPPVLSVAPSNLFFSAAAGSPNPTLQSLVISSPGGGTLTSWIANASQPWISLPNASGTGAQPISVGVLSGTLGLGTYTGTITIVSPGANPASQTINVTLAVQSPSTYSGGGGSTTGQTLYNGIVLPQQWPPVGGATQSYQIPPYISNPPAVIPIDVGRQLFVDDFLIQQSSLVRTQHQAVMYPGNPILSPGSTSPGSQFSDIAQLTIPYSDGVWFDPALQQFRMWFYCGVGNQVCFASSTDGKNWIRPPVPGAPPNLIDQVLQIGGGRDSDVVWMDLQDTNPQRRYKAFAYYPPANMLYWTSPDGLSWNLQTSNISSLQDRTTLFWNPFRSVWVDSMRQQFTVPASTYRQAVSSDRMRFYSESPDLSTWKPADFTDSFWTIADENDPPYYPNGTYPQLYNLDAVAYESVVVGLFSWFNPGPADGFPAGAAGPDIVELGVGFSRDGFYWVRPTRGGGPNNAFIPASNVVGTWNMGNTQSAGGGFLVVGDQLWFYFSGRNGTHSNATAGSTGLATLRRDGFYSMDAGSTPGILTTRPVKYSGQYMYVNVQDPAGALQIQVLDPNNSNAVLATSSRITADSTAQPVTFDNNLANFAGRPVIFQFTLTNGELYAFWVSQNANGASGGYVAAGGPGFSSNIDSVGTASLLAVPPASNTLSVSVPSISLTAPLGSGISPSQLLTITDIGGTLSWTTNTNPSWLTLSSSSGTGVQTVSVGANISGLGVGTYSGTLTILAPDAAPGQLTISVSLVITPSISAAPSTLSFSAPSTLTNPPAQPVTLSESGGTVGWTATSNQAWATLSNTANGSGSQTLTGTGAATIWVQANTAGLGTLSSSATVTFTSSGSASPSPVVNVTLTLQSLAGNGAQHFVAPNGSHSGSGTLASPWDLQTALNQPASLHPGDILWLLAGTYQAPAGQPFSSYLNGTAASPIVIRNYSGQRATINTLGTGMGLYVYGSYAWFWGLEFMDTTTTRTSSVSGSGANPNSPGIFVSSGTGNKFVNMIVHDTAEGFFASSASTNTEFNGNIVYNNGWLGPDRGHGHGFYVQNQSPSVMTLTNNVIFQGFGEGIQCYGSPTAWIQNVSFDGNTIFNSGMLGGQGDDYNLLVAGGTNGPQNITVTNNYTYHTPSSGTGLSSLSWGGDTTASNLIADNNYWIGGNPSLDINAWSVATFTNETAYSKGYLLTASELQPATYNWRNNTYYGSSFPFSELNSHEQSFASWVSLTGLGTSDTFTPASPTGTWVFVRPNAYETGRANITIYNWPLASSVPVDVSSVLPVGSQYEIHNAQNFFASPVISGTYSGGALSIPMTGLTVAQAVGNVPAQPQTTGPQFATFVLLQK